jgi:hypothetical protein
MLIQKVDEEDGNSFSNVAEYPTTPRPPQESTVVDTQVREETPLVVEEYPTEESSVDGEIN